MPAAVFTDQKNDVLYDVLPPVMILRFNAVLSALSIPSHPVSVHLLPWEGQR